MNAPLTHLAIAFAAAVAAAGCEGVPGASADDPDPKEREHADVLAVAVEGDPGAYRFRVRVRSPDRGCDQYADWWEVVRPDATLAYRRILRHSHPDEQPFTRSGGPVEIAPDDKVYVRAHMKPTGYGGRAMAGTPRGGFQVTELPGDFAAHLERVEPQPEGCLR